MKIYLVMRKSNNTYPMQLIKSIVKAKDDVSNRPLSKLATDEKFCYELTKKSNEDAPVIIIPEGFNIYAGIFNILWLIYHKMWKESIIYTSVLMILAFSMGYQVAIPVFCLFALYTGLCANDMLMTRFYEPKGYIVTNIIKN